MRFRFLEADDCLFLMKRRSAVEVETYFFISLYIFSPLFIVWCIPQKERDRKMGCCGIPFGIYTGGDKIITKVVRIISSAVEIRLRGSER